MNQKPTLLLLGLLACGNTFACNPAMYVNPNYCEEEREEMAALRSSRERDEAKQEADWQSRRSIQVIEPNDVTTYYPSSDGRSYTGYSLRNR